MKQQKAAIGANAVDGKAPGNKWWDYIVSAPKLDGNNQIEYGTLMTAAQGNGSVDPVYKKIRYIPSLGLYLKVPAHSFNETGPAEDAAATTDPDKWACDTNDTGLADLANTQKRRNASWILEAGTDCIGFAQRCASWNGNAYAWENLAVGVMEYNQNQGTENPYVSINAYGEGAAGTRNYPITLGYANSIVHNKSGQTWNGYYQTKESDDDPLTQEEKDALLRALKCAVPGDIWVKESEGVGDWTSHIAIVAEIPDNPDEITDPKEYMEKMVLIEAEFTNKIQSVIKRLSIGMYNNNEIPVGTVLYPNFVVEDTKPKVDGPQGIALNCSSWAIRRLVK